MADVSPAVRAACRAVISACTAAAFDVTLVASVLTVVVSAATAAVRSVTAVMILVPCVRIASSLWLALVDHIEFIFARWRARAPVSCGRGPAPWRQPRPQPAAFRRLGAGPMDDLSQRWPALRPRRHVSAN